MFGGPLRDNSKIKTIAALGPIFRGMYSVWMDFVLEVKVLLRKRRKPLSSLRHFKEKSWFGGKDHFIIVERHD